MSNMTLAEVGADAELRDCIACDENCFENENEKYC
jgi:hypothetical protein